MIGPIVRASFLNLARSRADIVLTFLVPILFFSVFTLIFDRGVGTTRELVLAVVDEEGSDASRELIRRLEAQDGLRIHDPATEGGVAERGLRSDAERAVRRGFAKAVVVIPQGWSTAFAMPPVVQAEPPTLELLVDSSDPIAGQLIRSLLSQQVVGLAAPGPTAAAPRPVLQVVDLLAAGKTNPAVAMHAAGIAVMFLLFGAVTSAGTLIDEEESGTLERILATRVSMLRLLLGKWLFLTSLGVVQVTTMFVWGQLVFDADLTGHLPGFLVMTVVTSMAASSLALLLAGACRSRTQLNGVAVIVILCLSALGGSMIPRYVMSEEMQRVGLLSFNAWALDGYMKVFWLERPIVELAPQAAVLVGSALVLFAGARQLARRWETL